MKKRGKRRVSGFAKGAISESETGVDSSNFGWKTGNEGMTCLSTQGKEEKKVVLQCSLAGIRMLKKTGNKERAWWVKGR